MERDGATGTEAREHSEGGALDAAQLVALASRIRAWGAELGFSAVAVADLDVSAAAVGLADWLAEGRHGEMDYLVRHAAIRAEPQRLLPGAVRAICARMDYLPRASGDGWVEREWERLHAPAAAVVALYARGRDYHKVLRGRLAQLAGRIAAAVGPFGYRVCTDSAPVFEVELARRAGLGWRGKHTLLLSREHGSLFFLGEILTDLPLPPDPPTSEHCGTCTRCIEVCPTRAITAPYRLDARRCISYLTIEHRGSIPLTLRPLIGNRVYGCDDCQLACPWNRHAQVATLADFDVRHGLDAATLVELFAWDRATFETRHAGSAIRRIGYERWLRNLAVAMGNAPPDPALRMALRGRRDHPSALVREHVHWALVQHGEPA